MCGSKLLRWMFPIVTVLIMVTQVEASRLTYTITDLGKNITPSAINNGGQVVGFLTVASGQRHAFLYQRGVLKDLGTFNGTDSQANAVNNRGHIVGTYTNNGDKHGFLLDHGRFVDLFAAAAIIDATGINNTDIIIGKYIPPGENFHRVGLYDNGLLTDIYAQDPASQMYGPQAEAIGLNDLGEAILFQGMCGSWECEYSFLFSKGKISTIWPAKVTAINDVSQVTGSALNLEVWFQIDGFIYEGAKKSTISDLGGQQTHPASINNLGVIVGTAHSNTNADRAFIYSSDCMIDLNTLLPPSSGWTLLAAMDINDRGHIVGTGLLRGEQHAFILKPSLQKVKIDIKPGDARNSVNLRPHLQLPVVVFGSSVFDASSIKPASIKVTGEGNGLKGRGDRYLFSIKDVNGDGLKDLVSTVLIDEVAFTPRSSTQVLTLEATTSNGESIQGEERVWQVGKGR